ncbi:MAG: cysteine desulfurase family protein [Clostridiales bacterium]|nr:cysteine desulfurase family protein [Clostridiales bacterium]
MIYLDNASTTKPSQGARDAALAAFENFGNPSSLHRLGMDAEKIIRNTGDDIARVLGVDAKNIYFTSGGTESNNTAIFGYVRGNKKRGNHIITTAIEHPSVLEPFHILEKEGFEVTYLPVDKSGAINLDDLKNALRSDTILVSVMTVNNETGVIQPFEKLKEIMKGYSPKAALHCDGVQGFCKIDIKPKKCGIDMLSVSAHKIHGIKGTGALYIADGVHIAPIIAGGGQQKNIRSGTENVVGIAAFGGAVRSFKRISRNKRTELAEKLTQKIDNISINGEGLNSGYVLNVSFLGTKAEILLHSLEAKGIYVSSGSACSSNHPAPSHVLTAMGKTAEEIRGAIRVSFSDEDFDTDFVAETVKNEVDKIRKYVR